MFIHAYLHIQSYRAAQQKGAFSSLKRTNKFVSTAVKDKNTVGSFARFQCSTRQLPHRPPALAVMISHQFTAPIAGVHLLPQGRIPATVRGLVILARGKLRTLVLAIQLEGFLIPRHWWLVRGARCRCRASFSPADQEEDGGGDEGQSGDAADYSTCDGACV